MKIIGMSLLKDNRNMSKSWPEEIGYLADNNKLCEECYTLSLHFSFTSFYGIIVQKSCGLLLFIFQEIRFGVKIFLRNNVY